MNIDIANKVWTHTLSDNPHLKEGLNVAEGKLTYAAVGKTLDMEYVDADSALG